MISTGLWIIFLKRSYKNGSRQQDNHSFKVTDASVYDSREIVELVDEKNKEIYADSVYVGEALHVEIQEKNPEVQLQINEKGYRNEARSHYLKSSGFFDFFSGLRFNATSGAFVG